MHISFFEQKLQRLNVIDIYILECTKQKQSPICKHRTFVVIYNQYNTKSNYMITKKITVFVNTGAKSIKVYFLGILIYAETYKETAIQGR